MGKAVRVINIVNAIYLFIWSVIFFLMNLLAMLITASGQQNSRVNLTAQFNLVLGIIFPMLLFWGGALLLTKRGYKYIFLIIVVILCLAEGQVVRLVSSGGKFGVEDIIDLSFMLFPLALAIIAMRLDKTPAPQAVEPNPNPLPPTITIDGQN